MSLSLKTLENTTHYEVYNERTIFHTTRLPTLEGNIKCGNSLVGTDIYKIQQEFLYSNRDELNDLNVFDWKKEFNFIFKDSGFNCVLGNPPYIFSI